MNPEQSSQYLKSLAYDEGFFLQGICPAVQPPHYGHFLEWLEKGYAGQMDYLPNRKEAYRHPQGILQGARSVMMLGMNYFPHQDKSSLDPNEDPKPKLARYVHSGVDYHDVIHKSLKRMIRTVAEKFPDWKARGVVDTAPLLERDFARLSGLGWVGKNTMLINKRAGSYFFLAAVIVDQELVYDQPHETDHCGTCRRCLDACPTDAFVQEGVMDATRCISYWTIESKEVPPEGLIENFGDWFFGCDICQEVCPWNRHSKPTQAEGLTTDTEFVDIRIEEFFEMDEQEFRQKYRKTPLWRSRLEGMMRNAAIFWGNNQDDSKKKYLLLGVEHPSDSVQQASRWALERMNS